MTVSTLSTRPVPSPLKGLQIALSSIQEGAAVIAWVQGYQSPQAVHVSLPAVHSPAAAKMLRRRFVSLGCTVSTRHHV